MDWSESIRKTDMDRSAGTGRPRGSVVVRSNDSFVRGAADARVGSPGVGTPGVAAEVVADGAELTSMCSRLAGCLQNNRSQTGVLAAVNRVIWEMPSSRLSLSITNAVWLASRRRASMDRIRWRVWTKR